MNPFLAELYNTAENIGSTKVAASDENEKLAQAYVLDQMLQNEGLSIDQLSAQDIVKVATEIFGSNSPLVKQAEEGMPPAVAEEKKEEKEESEEEKEKEAREKLAEADFLGRAMAHAYVDELRGIEKKASAEKAGVPNSFSQLLTKNASNKSALDVLAEQRAEEILKQASVQTDDAQQKLAHAVEARAIEILKANGYNVE